MAKKIKETHSTDSTSSLQAMDKIIALAKNRGFIFAGSEIYGGLAGTWDYGPLGAELVDNIKNCWWKKFLYDREDIYKISPQSTQILPISTDLVSQKYKCDNSQDAVGIIVLNFEK